MCAGAGAIAQTSAAPTCADLHLVPALRECTAVKSIPIGSTGISGFHLMRNAEDEFAALKDLARVARATRGIAVARRMQPCIRTGTADISEERSVSRSHIKFDRRCMMKAYVIVPT